VRQQTDQDTVVDDFRIPGEQMREINMDAIETTTANQLGQEMSRRRLVRKAAYTAPVVFAIAAAPQVALGTTVTTNPGGQTGGVDKKNPGEKPKR